MKTTTILLALAFGITACSASTGEELPTQDDNSANDSGDVRYDVVYLIHGHYGAASTTFEAEDGLQRKVLDHMTFHEKDGSRHEFLPTPEYVYNALPFFFSPQDATGIKAVDVSKKIVSNKSYGIDGRLFASQGIVIDYGKKILARHYE